MKSGRKRAASASARPGNGAPAPTHEPEADVRDVVKAPPQDPAQGRRADKTTTRPPAAARGGEAAP